LRLAIAPAGFCPAPLKLVAKLLLTLEATLLVFTACLLLLGFADGTCIGLEGLSLPPFGLDNVAPLTLLVNPRGWKSEKGERFYTGKYKVDLNCRLMSLKLLPNRTCMPMRWT